MRRFSPLLLALLAAVLPATAASAQTAPSDDAADAPDESPVVHDIVFPVIGEVTYTDTFGAPRGSGRTHEGQDLSLIHI